MSEIRPVNPDDESASESVSEASDMRLLRQLLIAPEQEKLDEAERRIRVLEERKTAVSAGELADLLPDAVVERSGRDTKLASALAPTVEETLRGSIRRNPQPIVDAIFPIIGPAIRRSIAEALSSTLESVNRVMENQFSFQGLAWRIEAIRTGQSFSEVVLRNTLLYATQQIFVIDNDSGLPLAYVSRQAGESADGSLVTSMLSVIQDFVRDSLGGDSADSLESIEYGDLTILFEPGPRATLAVVIEGSPPRTVREDLQELIEEFHLRYRVELEEYDGDPSIFDKAVPLLSTYLKVQRDESGQTGKKTLVLFGLLVFGLGLLSFFYWQSRVKWNDLVDRVDAVPGIRVTETMRDGKYRIIRGLRDPLSNDPVQLVSSAGYDPARVRFEFEPIRAMAPTVVARRSAKLLNAPASVSFVVVDDTLFANGSADHRWLTSARARAVELDDVNAFVDAGVVDLDVRRLLDVSDEVSGKAIAFRAGSNLPESTEFVSGIVDEVQQALVDAQAAGLEAVAVVRGFASSEGSTELNALLQIQRANTIRQMLVDNGLSPNNVIVERGGIGQRKVEVVLRVVE